MHQPVDPPPDPAMPDEPGASGLHNRDSHPAAMRCRCGRPRVRRVLLRAHDGTSTAWLYCRVCDEIPPMQRPQDPTTKETP